VADVVGVVFHNGVKIYYFDPAGLELSRGDRVVVQTSKGSEIGQVVEPPHTVDDSEIQAQLKKVTRIATGKDLETQASDEQMRKQAMATCRELIESHGLDMKLVGADIGFGGEKITISFYSDERVDFRALVTDLAKALKMRIELRQVGAREEARMVGGLGPCGRNLCCTMFAGDDDPVSIRMAKEQNLPLNPMKISGLCGRLMCCLKYEQEQYVSFRKEAPSRGTSISTPTGDAVVVGYNVPKDAITVKYEDGSVGDIRLAGCQCQEGGGLVVVPEEEPQPVGAFDDAIELGLIGNQECTPEALALVEAEVVTGEDGEAVQVIVGDGSRRSKGRRGRRGGKRRTKTPDEAEAVGGASGDVPTASGDERSGSHRRGHKPPRHSHHKGEDRAAEQRDEAGSSRAEQVEGEGTPSASSGRSRRRRKRRSSGGGGQTGGQTGGPTGGSAGVEGGSGQGGGAGSGDAQGG
jgi:cell fate regulator YaaT (PSP1 superfamily)